MKSMCLSAVLILGMSWSVPGGAAEVAVDVHAVALVTNDVPVGVTKTLTEPTNMSARTAIRKTGSGTLRVSSSAIGLTPLNFRHAAGTLEITNDTTEARAAFRRAQERKNVQIGVYCAGADTFLDESHVAEFADCHVDYTHGLVCTNRATLDLYSQYGIASIASRAIPTWAQDSMSDALTPDVYETRVENYLQNLRHPAIAYLYLCDEPRANRFEALGEQCALIDRLAPETPAFVNLYPNYATSDLTAADGTDSQLGTDSYADYIEQYCQKVPTPYICYDHYAFRDDVTLTTEHLLPRLFENYRIVANACHAYDRAHWVVLQLNTYAVKSTADTKKLTLDQLRFQAWTAMAYGAERISWGCWGPGWYTNNVYDAAGVRDDEQYQKLRSVNAEIKAIGRRFMAYRNTTTYLVDFSDAYTNVDAAANGAFTDVRATDASPLVVGEMTARDGSGARAIFIVPAGNPCAEAQAAHTITFTAAGTLALYSSDDSAALTATGENTWSLTLTDNRCALVTQNAAATAGTPAGDLSAGILDKLALWVSVKDSEMTRDGSSVLTWYDVRETNLESPTCNYLTAILDTNGVPVDATRPKLEYARYVRKYGTSTNGMTMVYFGGYGNGAAMRFRTPGGGNDTTRPAECTCVYGYVNHGKAFGILYGNALKTNEHTMWSETDGLPWDDAWAPSAGETQIWVDGRRFPRDGRTLPYGFHVLTERFNGHCSDSVSFQNALFSSRETTGTRGGQHLGEVMFFKTKLTFAERNEVQRYLRCKWFGVTPSTATVALESGAELDAASGDGDVLATGTGRFVKRGDGAYVYAPADFANASQAAVTIEGGTVEATRALSVRAAAGKRITARLVGDQQHAPRLSASDLADGETLEKDGAGDATFPEIPTGTKTLRVSAGALTLRPSRPAVRRYEVAIPNGDFSDWGDDTTHGTVYAEYGGWSRSGVAVFYDQDRWKTMAGTPTGDKVYITAYGYNTCPPPEGRRVLMLKVIGAKARVADVVFPESGEYELSYMMTTRDTTSCGARVRNYLTDAAGNETPIGTAVTLTIKSWTEQQTLRFSVAEGGAYTLHFDLVTPWYNGKTGTDAAVLINSLHLYRVGERAKGCKIPNGGFEDVTSGTDSSGQIKFLTGEALADGWTFDTTIDSKYARAGVVSPSTYCEEGRRYGSGYNGSHAPFGGQHQALIRRNGGYMTTTFTPPAGTWYVKAFMAYWGSYTEDAAVTVTARQGEGDAVNLGAVAPIKDLAMLPCVWPVPFASDGATPVTLTFTYVRPNGGIHGVNLDDIELVGEYENERELLANGDFEAPFHADRENVAPRTSWTYVSTVVDKSTLGSCSARQYGRDNWAFGTDYGSGDYFMEPYNLRGPGGFYQDVTFPHDGWYRLSYLAKRRLDASVVPTRFDIFLVDVAAAATNRIDSILEAGRGRFEQRTVLFHVDAPGTRRLLFLDNTNNRFIALDDLSVRYVGATGDGALAQPDPAARGLAVRLEKNTLLKLDYTGTNAVTRFSASGVKYPNGVVNAQNCPQIVGPGALCVGPNGRGVIFILR